MAELSCRRLAAAWIGVLCFAVADAVAANPGVIDNAVSTTRDTGATQQAVALARPVQLAALIGTDARLMYRVNRTGNGVQLAQLSGPVTSDATLTNPASRASMVAPVSQQLDGTTQSGLDGSEWSTRNGQLVVRTTDEPTWSTVSTPAQVLAFAVDSVGNKVWVATASGLGYVTLTERGAFRPVSELIATQLAVNPDSGRLAFYVDETVWTLDSTSPGSATPQRLSTLRGVEAMHFDLASNQLIVRQSGAWQVLPRSEAPDTVVTEAASHDVASPYVPRSALKLIPPAPDRADQVRLHIDIQCDGLDRCDESERYLRTLSITATSAGLPISLELVSVDATGVVTLQLPWAPTEQSGVNLWATDAFGRTSNVITLPSPDQQKANALPTVALTVPTANQVFTLPTTIVLKATASDSDGTISKVEFFRGGTTLVGAGTLSSGVYSFSWTSATAGSYSITAKATDNAGGTKTTAARTMIVNAAPTVNLELPLNAATFTAPATVALRATAADSDGTISKVEFFRGTTLISTGTLSAGKYTASWTNVAAGTYSVTAKATDNRSAATSSTAATITVCGAPTIAWSSPATGTVTNLASPVATGANLALAATASVPAACGAVGKVEFYNGTTLLGTGTLTAGVYNYAWNNVAPGTYSVKARAYLNATATTADSAVVSLIVNRPPSVTLDIPATGASFSAPATISLSATASDVDGTLSKVEFFNGTTLVATGTLNAGKYTASWTNVAAGSYSLTAKATDNRGAATSSTPATSVTVASCTAPTVTWISPAAGAIINLAAPLDTGVTVPLVATASLSAACGGVGRVDFYRGTTLLGTSTQVGDQYTYNWLNVASGTYSVKARAYKGATATFTDSSPVSVTVNAPPYISISTTLNGAVMQGLLNIPLEANASDADGSVATVEFVSNGTVVATGTRESSTYRATWGSVGPGSYSVVARATDNRGAVTTTVPISFTVIAETNLAAGKLARQSTDAGADSTADRALDGSGATAATTSIEDYPWWEVDLGQGYGLSRIEITPQGTTGALDDFWLILSAAPISTLNGDDLSLQQLYGDVSGASDAFAIPVVGAVGNPISVPISDTRPCCSAKSPRYVRLWSRKPGVQLALADVKLFGSALPGGYSHRAVGGLLTGVSDGQSINAAGTLDLGITPKRETNDGGTYTVARVAYYDGQTKLAEITGTPFGYAFPAAIGDYRFRARIEWTDGAWAWTNEANVRVQSAADTALRISWPKDGGEAFAGDAGIPNYFTLRGSWLPDATASLEYLFDCVPSCFGTPTWRPIRYRKGAAFAALVSYPFVGGATQLTVRATAQSGAVQSTTINFTKRPVSLQMLEPNLVDAAGQTVIGIVRGVDQANATTTANFYLEEVYYRDGQMRTLSAPCAGSGFTGPWLYGSCGDSAGVQVLRQFYGPPVPVQLPLGPDNTFTRAAIGFASNPIFGEGGGSVAVVPFSGGPRGWFNAFATGNIVVPGYKAYPAWSHNPVVLRYGNLPPEVIDLPTDQTLWQGDLPLSVVLVDYDESRVLPAANVTWRNNGVVVATATSCAVVLNGGDPMEHKFRCTGTWVSPPIGTFPMDVQVTDLQGLTTVAGLGNWTIQSWTAAITAPADNAPFAAGTIFSVTAALPVTAPFNASVQLLQDGNVISTKTTQNGTVSFTLAPPVGTHIYRVIATSPTGASATSQTITVRVVNSPPPTVSITSPSATADFSVPASVPVAVSASSPSGTIALVVVRSNGVEIARLTNAPFTYNWTGAAVGQYSLVAEAFDNQGLSTLSAPVTVRVYAAPPAPPTVAMVFPSGLTGFSTTDQSNGWACLQITASSSDSLIVRTKVLVNGAEDINLQQDLYTPSPSTSRYACVSNLPVGVHTLKARGETSRGAVADSATLNVTIAATSVTMTQPVSRDFYATGFSPAQVQGVPLTLAMQVGSGVPNPAHAEFYATYSDLQYGRAPFASSSGLPLTTTWTATFTGFQQLIGCVVDTAGVRSCANTGGSIPFRIATRAIAVTLAGPTTAGEVPVTYSVALALGDSVSVQTVGLFDADSGELLAEKATEPYDFTLSIPLSRKLIAVARSTDDYQFVSSVLPVTSSNQAPTIAIARPATGSEFPASSTIPVLVEGADPDGTASQVELWRVGENGNPDTLLASANAATLTYPFLLPASTQTIRLYANVFDSAGAKVKSAITSITVRADITDPRYFVWTNMNAALKAGNKAAALEFLTPTAQENYSTAFELILPQAPSIVASYSPLLLISDAPDRADYLVGRTINGQRVIFGIQFIRMDDGRWKLESM